MKKLLVLTTILAVPITAHAGMTAKSLEALRKYCVPDPKITNDDGTTVCNSDFMGEYDFKTDKCKCKNPTLLQWDETIRRCKIKCPVGTRPEIVNESEKQELTGCPKGYKVDAQIN